MRADRLLSIMLILQAQGKTTTLALSEKLEVSRRTILRDIDALSIAGIPIHADAGHNGGVYLDEHYRVSLTGLTESEVRALFVFNQPSPLRDVGLGRAVEDTLLKLFAILPAQHRQEAEWIQQRILLDPASWWPPGETLPHLEILKVAVFGDYRIQVRYSHGDGRVVEHILEPYSLVAKASVWYLIARRDGELHTYRVSRLIAVETMNERFDRDATFDLTTYWHTHVHQFIANLPSFTFTLRLNANRLKLLRLYAEGGYTIRDTSPDGAVLTIDMRLTSLEEAKMLVLGLGTDADVIEPDELREAVLLQAQQMVTHLSVPFS
ncbi:MAG: YafY family transcriptional regulator [Anaerolineae bacterium]|nr:YafY family transcriptional regulator [Anaerolineae bacterium]